MYIDYSLIAGIENVLTQFCFMELLKSKLDISMLGYYIITVRKDKKYKMCLFLCVSMVTIIYLDTQVAQNFFYFVILLRWLACDRC